MLNLLEKVVNFAKKEGADDAEAMIVSEKSRSVSVRLGKRENFEQLESVDFGVRVICQKKQAVVSGNHLSSIFDMTRKAIYIAKLLPEDSSVGLADPEQLVLPNTDHIQLFHDIKEIDPNVLEELARRMESEAYVTKDIINTEESDARYSLVQTSFFSSNGFVGVRKNSLYSLSIAMVAGNQDGMEVDSSYSSSVMFDDLLTPEALGQEAAKRAVARLSPRTCTGGSVPVIFESRVARNFVGYLLSAINGNNVASKKSFLANMEGEKIASSVTIREDPHRPRGLGSQLFDAEGLPTTQKNIIDCGVLETFLLDLSSARRLEKKPTGNAERCVNSIPYPSFTNVYLCAGNQSVSELIQNINNGLFVTDLLGSGVNLTTGGYSQGACGFWINNGVFSYPVNEVTLAGQLQDMLQHITPASDLLFRHRLDSPSILIDGITVAGT